MDSEYRKTLSEISSTVRTAKSELRIESRRANRVATAALFFAIISMIMIIILYVLYYTQPVPAIVNKDETVVPADKV
jgi:hypothetical protein